MPIFTLLFNDNLSTKVKKKKEYIFQTLALAKME